MIQQTVYHTISGIYKTGRYQSNGQRWYGKMKIDGTMGFVRQEDFEKAIKFPVNNNAIPTIEVPPF